MLDLLAITLCLAALQALGRFADFVCRSTPK